MEALTGASIAALTGIHVQALSHTSYRSGAMAKEAARAAMRGDHEHRGDLWMVLRAFQRRMHRDKGPQVRADPVDRSVECKTACREVFVSVRAANTRSTAREYPMIVTPSRARAIVGSFRLALTEDGMVSWLDLPFLSDAAIEACCRRAIRRSRHRVHQRADVCRALAPFGTARRRCWRTSVRGGECPRKFSSGMAPTAQPVIRAHWTM